MHHQHGAVRPAVPDSTHVRRRTNSNIVPAVPVMPPYQYTHHSHHHPHVQPQPHLHGHPQSHPHYPYAYPQHQPQTPPVPPTIPVHTPPPPAVPLPHPPPSQVACVREPEPFVPRAVFKPPLPWYSAPGTPFPGRRKRRRRPVNPPTDSPSQPRPSTPQPAPEPSAAPSVSEVATPPTTNPPSEIDSTYPTTPSSTAPPSTVTSVPVKPPPAVPLTTPAVPVITPKARTPKSSKNGEKPQPISTNGSVNGETAPATPTIQTGPATAATLDGAAPSSAEKHAAEPVADETAVAEAAPASASPPQPTKPASWADLLKNENQKKATPTSPAVKVGGPVNGLYGSLEDALKSFEIRGDAIITPFLEPRGLINTGNMCFMNVILQMLVFCGPFYHFLDRISASAKSFKDDTPLIETMIMFMREFRVVNYDLKSNKIKADDLDALGEAFAPEYFYETIRKLKRFSHMSRGHQQDAEEFLGFLLDGLHEEAVEVMKKVRPNAAQNAGDYSKSEESGWMEVGPKQKASSTRTTEIGESPITNIFGGKLKSTFTVPGLPPSTIFEPYTPLQLDIHTPDVNSVADALKHLTYPETIHGDFKSPRGPNVTATKKVSIHTLPPVLILHLKRFQYDNTGGTQKIWKKIAYPLELEIPREAIASGKRPTASLRYRLIGVVYHHGSSAQGGHYTVDVLRQDAKSWIRFDDTSIQAVAPKDVAVDVKDVGKYNGVDGEEEQVNNWEQVNGGGSRSGGQNKTDNSKYVGKDSRTAYILFYRRI